MSQAVILFVAVLLSLTTCTMTTSTERFIQSADATICLQTFGDKKDPCVLLLMGATASMLWWDEAFCRQLADQGFYVIRYDNRDTGRSTTYAPGTAPYSIDDLVDDAMRVLDANQIPRAHFVGMSLGGLVTQIAALKYPERVQSLTLLATGPWGPSDPSVPEMDPRIVQFQGRASRIDWTDEDAVVAFLLEGSALTAGRNGLDRPHMEQLFRAEFRRATRYVSMYNHATLQGGEAYYGHLQDIRQPSLIIHGTDDKVWHFKHAEFLRKTLPASTLTILEGTGHELRPADWNTIIQALITHLQPLHA